MKRKFSTTGSGSCVPLARRGALAVSFLVSTSSPTRRRFSRGDLNDVLALGSDGSLWMGHGPFGVVPPARQQADGYRRLPTA